MHDSLVGINDQVPVGHKLHDFDRELFHTESRFRRN